MNMNEYFFDIYAREKGAIGINIHTSVTVKAENYDAAVLKLYDTHEHISIQKWSEFPVKVQQ